MVLKFAEKKTDVAIADIRYEETQSVTEEIRALGCRTLALKRDVGYYDEVVAGFDQIKREFGTVDILVNNAAIMTNFATIPNMKKRHRKG